MSVLDRFSFSRNPYRYFYWARKLSPVLWVRLFELKGWLVTGFEEAEAILKDARFIKNQWALRKGERPPDFPEHLAPAYDVVRRMILFMDPPDHTRIRSLVAKAFAPSIVNGLRAEIERLCDELIARRAGRREHELIADFAYLLPLRTVGALLGVPVGDEARLRRWSDAFIHLVDFDANRDVWEDVGPAIIEFQQYLETVIAAKRRAPGQDLISTLIAVEEQGQTLTLDEMVSTCMLLLMAGHDTTTNLITNGYYWLLKNPTQYQLLKSDPSLAAGAVTETLRYDSPTLLTCRWVREDLTFAGKAMTRGQVVMIALGGANRDPRTTTHPDIFDITRKPNRHLAFAAGVHYCLGAVLGRLETEIALCKLLTHFVNPVLVREPRLRKSIVMHGYESLHVHAEIASERLAISAPTFG